MNEMKNKLINNEKIFIPVFLFLAILNMIFVAFCYHFDMFFEPVNVLSMFGVIVSLMWTKIVLGNKGLLED